MIKRQRSALARRTIEVSGHLRELASLTESLSETVPTRKRRLELLSDAKHLRSLAERHTRDVLGLLGIQTVG